MLNTFLLLAAVLEITLFYNKNRVSIIMNYLRRYLCKKALAIALLANGHQFFIPFFSHRASIHGKTTFLGRSQGMDSVAALFRRGAVFFIML
jgi:hypothetical protein